MLFLVDKEFADTKQNKLHKAKFIAKEHKQLIVNTPLKFNSNLIQLTLDKTTITLT